MKFRMIKIDPRHRTVHEYCHMFETFVVNRLESGHFEENSGNKRNVPWVICSL
jgi:hypothetical protein